MNKDMMVTYKLSRKMYLSLCEHKGFKPREEPYIDHAMMVYAKIAVDTLGYDDVVLRQLNEEE